MYGTTADGYFYQMLADKDCDIAINIDEDAFVVNEQALISLLDYVIANDIVCCGMNDGGVLPIRFCNPIIINPFFNIINLRAIREKFNRVEIESFDYEEHKDELLAIAEYKNIGYSEIKLQYEKYLSEGFKDDIGLFECGVLVRHHGDDKLEKLMESWWKEFCSGIKRDQISLPPAIEKMKFSKYAIMEGNVFRNQFEMVMEHSSNS